MQKITQSFILSAGVLLLITSLAKFASGFGSVYILNVQDPIFGIPFRYLFWTVGFFEFAVAIVCLNTDRVIMQAWIIAWLATGIVIYRFGLYFVNYTGACPCLGNLAGVLHISSKTAELIMGWIAAYLLIGSYSVLFFEWQKEGNKGGH